MPTATLSRMTKLRWLIRLACQSMNRIQIEVRLTLAIAVAKIVKIER
jgi:hypothetical protein